MACKTELALPTMCLTLESCELKMDMSQRGWKLAFQSDPHPGAVFLRLKPALWKGETSASIRLVVGRTVSINCATQHHAERMLEIQNEIPIEWREFFLLFLGTTWLDTTDCKEQCFLRFDQGDSLWHLRWSNINNDEVTKSSQIVMLETSP